MRAIMKGVRQKEPPTSSVTRASRPATAGTPETDRPAVRGVLITGLNGYGGGTGTSWAGTVASYSPAAISRRRACAPPMAAEALVAGALVAGAPVAEAPVVGAPGVTGPPGR